jgi:hypothetical protein
MIDSRIPGMESKQRVSSIDRQSYSATRTADLFLSVMWTGSCVSASISMSLYMFFRALVILMLLVRASLWYVLPYVNLLHVKGE